MTTHSTLTVAGKAASKGARASLHVAVALEAFRQNEALLETFDTSAAGLNEEQIGERLERDGLNEVTHEKPPHWALQLLHAFKNPFIVVLLVLAGVQLGTDSTNLTGPTIISVMVLISVLLSFSQEYRSSKAAEKLKAMVRNTATVTRRASDDHSERIDVPVGELVAGPPTCVCLRRKIYSSARPFSPANRCRWRSGRPRVDRRRRRWNRA